MWLVKKFCDEYQACTSMQGAGVSAFTPKQKQYPLVNGIDAARNSDSKENAK